MYMYDGNVLAIKCPFKCMLMAVNGECLKQRRECTCTNFGVSR